MAVTTPRLSDEEAAHAARADALLTELANELSQLFAAELELAAAARAPMLRQVAVEVAAAVCAAGAFLLMLAAATAAAIAGLALVLPTWLAALAVAGAWGVIGVLVASIDHPRRLWRRMRAQTGADGVAATLEARSAAEADLRETVVRLRHAMRAEMRARAVGSLVHGEQRFVAEGERDVEIVLKELLMVLTAPGRAGVLLVDKLLRGSPPDETAGGRR